LGAVEWAEAEGVYDAGREACVAFLFELSARYEREIARLQERVARLEEQARESSRTSSKPPSQDPPKTRAQRRAEARAKSKAWAKREGERKAGGQSGHEGAGRPLLPEDQVDVIVDHYPERCHGCGHEFGAEKLSATGRSGRYQVAELPPLAVILSEHRTQRLRCPRCRRETSATLPADLSGSAFGPRLQAAVATLSVRNRVSRRQMSELANELFGVTLASGTVDAICQRASAALAEPHERLVASILEADAVNVDETGWYRAGEARTLWTAATPTAAIFRIAEDRHRERLEELLGGRYTGIVCSDRWWAYDHLDPDHRQVCWQHLVRDFRRHAEGQAEQQRFGEAGLALTARLFETWHRYQAHGNRRRLARESKPIQAELRALLEQAGRKSTRTRYHRVFANKLLKIWPALWTFITVDGVEPTNNAAERALRGPVIHRKLSHGSQSHNGERFIERALSASVTCRLQGRSLFAYLAELLTAHARGDPLPALA